MEKIILNNLISNEEYSRKVLAFLKPDYFHNETDKLVFNLIQKFTTKYNTLPTIESLTVDLANIDGMDEGRFQEAQSQIEALGTTDKSDLQWLVDQTEEFCKDKALYNALRSAVKIVDSPKTPKAEIPKLLQEALEVSFDTQVGHDYFHDASARFDSYHLKERLIPFDLDYMNRITGGGLPPASLNIIMAPTGVGKTLVMCHMAAYNILCGKNVLYISMEMGEMGKPSISQRIDMNLLNMPFDDLLMMTKDSYLKRIKKLEESHNGSLVVKRYPTAAAGVGHFRHLLNELKQKRKFVPDIIYIDYLNICVSSRHKLGSGVNTNTYVQSIAEEIRGLAVEYDLPIVSATQTNRGAYSQSDFGLENTADSIGLPMTVDFMIGVIQTDELRELNQLLFKQLKNRYGDPGMNTFFVVGADKARMRLYDVDQSAQEDITDGPVMDNTDFGKREEDHLISTKFDTSKFRGFA